MLSNENKEKIINIIKKNMSKYASYKKGCIQGEDASCKSFGEEACCAYMELVRMDEPLSDNEK